MSANGRLAPSELEVVEPGVQLAAGGTTDDYRALRMFAADRGRTLRVAAPAGGYRSLAVQAAMHRAGSAAGTAAERARWGLNPHSVVAVAAAGYSTHGDGTRVDLVGTDLDWTVRAADDFGFTREFGPRDPNHFRHGTTRYGHPVPQTGSATSGRVGGPGAAFRKRVQLLARLSGYLGPVDGDEGVQTWAALSRELAHGRHGDGVPGLQRWAGVSEPDIDRTADWGKVRASNVRAVARKLNRL